MLKLVFLTKKFYTDYATCTEIEQKETRPYIRIQIVVNGVLWAIPLRSHINHPHVIWTDKENACGIDFSKAVVVAKPGKYISAIEPHIRPHEFRVLKQIDEYRVSQKMQQYIKEYKKAKIKPDIPRNQKLLQCSTLQYFERYI